MLPLFCRVLMEDTTQPGRRSDGDKRERGSTFADEPAAIFHKKGAFVCLFFFWCFVCLIRVTFISRSLINLVAVTDTVRVNKAISDSDHTFGVVVPSLPPSTTVRSPLCSWAPVPRRTLVLSWEPAAKPGAYGLREG